MNDPADNSKSSTYLRDLITKALKSLEETRNPPFYGSVFGNALRNHHHGFDVKDFGYSTLVELLSYYPDIVEIKRGVKDIEVYPAGKTPSEPPVRDIYSDMSQTIIQINTKLWKAFVDVLGSHSRYFDKRKKRAVLFPPETAEGESTYYTELRQAVDEDPENFIRIESISVEEQVRWMRSFASLVAEYNPKMERTLNEALSSFAPLRDFTRTVSKDKILMAYWNAYRSNEVAKHISAWFKENDIDIEDRDWCSRQTLKVPTVPKPVESKVTQKVQESALTKESELQRYRNIIKKTIDQMTLLDLMKMRVPIKYWLLGGIKRVIKEGIDQIPLKELQRLHVPAAYLLSGDVKRDVAEREEKG